MDENLAKVRHEQSQKDFPFLKLEEGEYVEFAFSRARICLFLIIAGFGCGLIIVLLALLLAVLGQGAIDDMGRNFMYVILTTLVLAAVVATAFAIMIYRGNRLFVTNKHVIQLIMTSPVASSTNIIDLGSIEDASYSQSGLLETLFHYGTFRLSTVGDETTYTFKYADISAAELKAVSDLVTNAKKRTRRLGKRGAADAATDAATDDTSAADTSTSDNASVAEVAAEVAAETAAAVASEVASAVTAPALNSAAIDDSESSASFKIPRSK